MACVSVLNCLLLILLNIFLTVSASRSPLPRYVVGGDQHHAIFGSSAFDPVKQLFEVNETEKIGENKETGSTKSPGDTSTNNTSKDNTRTVQDPLRKLFKIPGKFAQDLLRERTDSSDVTDAPTLETTVATVSSTNPSVQDVTPKSVNKLTNKSNVVEPIPKVKIFTRVDADDSSNLNEQTNPSVQDVTPKTVNKLTNKSNVVEPIPTVKIFTRVVVDADDSLNLNEQTYDNKIDTSQTKNESPVEPYKGNLLKQEPPGKVNKMTNESNVVEPIPKVHVDEDSSKLTYKITQKNIEPEVFTENVLKQESLDDYKKNESKLVALIAKFKAGGDNDGRELKRKLVGQLRRFRARGDYDDSREVNELAE